MVVLDTRKHPYLNNQTVGQPFGTYLVFNGRINMIENSRFAVKCPTICVISIAIHCLYLPVSGLISPCSMQNHFAVTFRFITDSTEYLCGEMYSPIYRTQPASTLQFHLDIKYTPSFVNLSFSYEQTLVLPKVIHFQPKTHRNFM